MSPHSLLRFAETSLSIYGKEGRFSITAVSEDELAKMAQAFEQLGCCVIASPHRLQLEVFVPSESIA